jgi:cell division septal protein FtsQ
MNPAHPINNSTEVKISFYKKLCRKKWFRILRPILVAGLLVLVVYILTIIGVFKIKEIELENELEYVGNITKVTNQYLGKGYFSLNLEQLEGDIQSYDNYVKEVKAEKIFPNSINILIQEYEPQYYFENKEVCYIISQEGLLLEENAEYEECSLEGGILIQAQDTILAEGKLIFDLELYKAVKILKEFGWEISKVEFQKNVMHIFDNEKSITIEVNQEYEDQLSKLYLVLEKANIEGIEYKSVDLRYQRPVMEIP